MENTNKKHERVKNKGLTHQEAQYVFSSILWTEYRYSSPKNFGMPEYSLISNDWFARVKNHNLSLYHKDKKIYDVPFWKDSFSFFSLFTEGCVFKLKCDDSKPICEMFKKQFIKLMEDDYENNANDILALFNK